MGRWIGHVRLRLGRRRTGQDSVVVVTCQAEAGVAARELDAASAMAKAGGPGPPQLWSVAEHACGIVGDGLGEPPVAASLENSPGGSRTLVRGVVGSDLAVAVARQPIG